MVGNFLQKSMSKKQKKLYRNRRNCIGNVGKRKKTVENRTNSVLVNMGLVLLMVVIL